MPMILRKVNFILLFGIFFITLHPKPKILIMYDVDRYIYDLENCIKIDKATINELIESGEDEDVINMLKDTLQEEEKELERLRELKSV